MYVIQEAQAPCIDINDTNSNHEVEKLIERLRLVARSCKEIRDKYHIYEGMSGTAFKILCFSIISGNDSEFVCEQMGCTT